MKYKIFWGGADIHPKFYGEIKNKHCGANNIARDEQEITLAKLLIEKQIPLIGICRGAQLLNVVNGGRLLQHIEDHIGYHLIETYDNRTLFVNSTHHQMMVPTEEAEILGVCKEPTYGIKHPEDMFASRIKEVPEVVYYPKTKCFCIQFHPEAMTQTGDTAKWVKETIKEKLNIDVTFYEDNEYYGAI